MRWIFAATIDSAVISEKPSGAQERILSRQWRSRLLSAIRHQVACAASPRASGPAGALSFSPVGLSSATRRSRADLRAASGARGYGSRGRNRPRRDRGVSSAPLDRRNGLVHVDSLPHDLVMQDEPETVCQHVNRNPQFCGTPALPFDIQRTYGSNTEKIFSSCRIVSPRKTRRRI